MVGKVVPLAGTAIDLDIQREFAAFAAEQAMAFKESSGHYPRVLVLVFMDDNGAIQSGYYSPEKDVSSRHSFALAGAVCLQRAME